MPFGTAVATLAGTAAAANAAPPVSDRLSHVQGLLADDLRWIEAALLEVAADGPAPGTQAARHLVASGGKRIRPIALLLSSACCGKIPEAARELAVVAELVHTATLLHDDVVDEGDTRRGLPTSRLVWGNAVSVLAGDLLLGQRPRAHPAPGARVHARAHPHPATPGRRRDHPAPRSHRARRLGGHLRADPIRQDRLAVFVGHSHGSGRRGRVRRRSGAPRQLRGAARLRLPVGRRRHRLRGRESRARHCSRICARAS